MSIFFGCGSGKAGSKPMVYMYIKDYKKLIKINVFYEVDFAVVGK